MARTTDKLSMTAAVLGMCSLICRLPLVSIGLNSPPFLEPGFKSQMSMVGGPPLIHIRMQAFCFFFSSAALA